MAHQIQPKITFILPVQNKQSLVIEQINNCFKFSEQYPGFCEIVVVTDDCEDRQVYLLWLAMKLNKVGCPHVRTKIIRYTSKININELVETGLKYATGQKIIVASNNLKTIRKSCHKNQNALQNCILSVPNFLNIDTLKKASLKQF